MASLKQTLETLRIKVWKLEQKVDHQKNEITLIKCQIEELESIGNKENNSGVEAVIDSSRVLNRRGSNAKKLALAQALKINRPGLT